ncbi:unnamed protein product [Closterium sp. Yama58-4]|nr:unnamed protein product [Closterium sp. Yama58-4]
MMRLCLPSAFLRLADEHELESQAVPASSPDRSVDPSHSLSQEGNVIFPQGGEIRASPAAAPPFEDPLARSGNEASRCGEHGLQTAAEQSAVRRNDAARWAERASLEAGRASLDAQQGLMSRLPPRPGGRFSLEESCCGRSYRCDNMCFRGLEAFPGEPTRRSDAAASPRPSAPKQPLERKLSSGIPRVMSDVDQISARHSDPVHIRGGSDRYPSRGRTWGSARDTACSHSASFANLGSLSATGSFSETHDSNHRHASGLGHCTRLHSSHRHSLGASLADLALIEEALGLSQQGSLHADTLRAEDHSHPGLARGDSLCGGCSWRAAELACSPMWVDSARSRIQEAALAVVEAQQAAVELSARIDEAEGRSTGGLALRSLPGLSSFPVTRRSFDGVASLRHQSVETDFTWANDHLVASEESSRDSGRLWENDAGWERRCDCGARSSGSNLKCNTSGRGDGVAGARHSSLPSRLSYANMGVLSRRSDDLSSRQRRPCSRRTSSCSDISILSPASSVYSHDDANRTLMCVGCSRLDAELACDPLWIDSARARIGGAALAVVEAQQAAEELSARVEMGATLPARDLESPVDPRQLCMGEIVGAEAEASRSEDERVTRPRGLGWGKSLGDDTSRVAKKLAAHIRKGGNEKQDKKASQGSQKARFILVAGGASRRVAGGGSHERREPAGQQHRCLCAVTPGLGRDRSVGLPAAASAAASAAAPAATDAGASAWRFLSLPLSLSLYPALLLPPSISLPLTLSLPLSPSLPPSRSPPPPSLPLLSPPPPSPALPQSLPSWLVDEVVKKKAALAAAAGAADSPAKAPSKDKWYNERGALAAAGAGAGGAARGASGRGGGGRGGVGSDDEEEDEEEEEEAEVQRRMAMNNEIKRVLTEVLLKVNGSCVRRSPHPLPLVLRFPSRPTLSPLSRAFPPPHPSFESTQKPLHPCPALSLPPFILVPRFPSRPTVSPFSRAFPPPSPSPPFPTLSFLAPPFALFPRFPCRLTLSLFPHAFPPAPTPSAPPIEEEEEEEAGRRGGDGVEGKGKKVSGGKWVTVGEGEEEGKEEEEEENRSEGEKDGNRRTQEEGKEEGIAGEESGGKPGAPDVAEENRRAVAGGAGDSGGKGVVEMSKATSGERKTKSKKKKKKRSGGGGGLLGGGLLGIAYGSDEDDEDDEEEDEDEEEEEEEEDEEKEEKKEKEESEVVRDAKDKGVDGGEGGGSAVHRDGTGNHEQVKRGDDEGERGRRRREGEDDGVGKGNEAEEGRGRARGEEEGGEEESRKGKMSRRSEGKDDKEKDGESEESEGREKKRRGEHERKEGIEKRHKEERDGKVKEKDKEKDREKDKEKDDGKEKEKRRAKGEERSKERDERRGKEREKERDRNGKERKRDGDEEGSRDESREEGGRKERKRSQSEREEKDEKEERRSKEKRERKDKSEGRRKEASREKKGEAGADADADSDDDRSGERERGSKHGRSERKKEAGRKGRHRSKSRSRSRSPQPERSSSDGNEEEEEEDRGR